MAKSEIIAETIPIARDQIPEYIPEGYVCLAQTVISEGLEHSLAASAPTTEEAFREARRQIPSDTTILSELEISPPLNRSLLIKAENAEEARVTVYNAYKRFYPKSVAIKLVLPGRKGLWGVGRKPNLYLAEVMLRNSRVEIRYRTKARLLIEYDRQENAAQLSL